MAGRQHDEFLSQQALLEQLRKYLIEKNVQPQQVISFLRALGGACEEMNFFNPQLQLFFSAFENQASSSAGSAHPSEVAGSSRTNPDAFGESIRAALYELNKPDADQSQLSTYDTTGDLVESDSHQHNTDLSTTINNVSQSPEIVDDAQAGGSTTADDGGLAQIQGVTSNKPVDSAVVVVSKFNTTGRRATDYIRFALHHYNQGKMIAADVIKFVQMLVNQTVLQPPNNPQHVVKEGRRQMTTFQYCGKLEDYCAYCKWLGLPPAYYFSHFLKDALANWNCPLYQFYNNGYIAPFDMIVNALMQLAYNMNVTKFCRYCKALGRPVEVYMSHVLCLSNNEIVCPYFKTLHP